MKLVNLIFALFYSTLVRSSDTLLRSKSVSGEDRRSLRSNKKPGYRALLREYLPVTKTALKIASAAAYMGLAFYYYDLTIQEEKLWNSSDLINSVSHQDLMAYGTVMDAYIWTPVYSVAIPLLTLPSVSSDSMAAFFLLYFKQLSI